MKTIKHLLIRGIPGALCAAVLASSQAAAATIEIPMSLNYAILDQALAEQVFTGPDGSAEVFTDQTRCNMLVLSEPQLEGTEDGRIRLRASWRAQAGTPLVGTCRFARGWAGTLDVLQEADIEPGVSAIRFHVTDSTLYSAEGKEVLPELVRDWMRDYFYPLLNSVRIDLQPAVAGIRELLVLTLDEAEGNPDSLRLASVRPENAELVVNLNLEVTDSNPVPDTDEQEPLSEAELAEWDAAWQTWDGFATWLIKTLAFTNDPELMDALAEILLDARYDLHAALLRDERDRDPVRDLFLKSWSRLAPLVQDIQAGLPGERALRYATFISAGNALESLDRLAPYLGLRLDSDALRQMARELAPGVTDYELRYDTSVDPELREMLGLDPDFEDGTEPVSWLSWLIPSAYATPIDPQLVQRLNSWTPRRRDVEVYLQTMDRLLNSIATTEQDKGKVPVEHMALYENLLRATAWQESCWRQYVEREGELETIRSSAGSVGLMQVNMHVWRGVYDIDQLLDDVGYNARAGNEILVHYLVDYAIRKGEHSFDGGVDNLARATYAVYNGGPRHLTRYRNPGTPASQKKIDKAFWLKYGAIQTEGAMAVKSCLGG